MESANSITAPRESHADEYLRLSGQPSAGDYIRRQGRELTAGQHLARRIRALSAQGEFTPNQLLSGVMAEYDELLTGGAG